MMQNNIIVNVVYYLKNDVLNQHFFSCVVHDGC